MIAIRKEEEKDYSQVREVLRAAFPSPAESQLVDALRENGKAVLSLVAVHGEEILGHILFSPVSTDPPTSEKGLGLAPVAVKPNVQAKGIGTQLILEGLRLCRELNYDYVVVLGDPGYYSRFGFEQASPFGIQNEYGVDDAFMVIQFSGAVIGLVKYAREFSLFSV